MISLFSIIAGGTVYIATSLFLARNPQILWRRGGGAAASAATKISPLMKQALLNRGKKVLHISHRGGSHENFENSEMAFDNSVEKCQTDVIETDVCITKDGEVLCLHDPHLLRLCGIDEESSNVNLENIVYLKKIPTEFSAGVGVFTTQEGELAKPITLDGLFRKFPKTHVNLEIKTRDLRTLEAVDEIIKRHDRTALTQWGSFCASFNCVMNNKNSEIPIFVSSKYFMLMMAAHAVGLLPFLPITGEIFQIPFYTRDYELAAMKKAAENGGGLMKWASTKLMFLGLKGFIPLLPSFNEHLNKRGALVFYWVLNKEEDFQAAVRSNPNGIITDTPTILKEFLRKNDLLLLAD